MKFRFDPWVQCEETDDGERCRKEKGHPGTHYAEEWQKRKDGQPDMRYQRPIGLKVWS